MPFLSVSPSTLVHGELFGIYWSGFADGPTVYLRGDLSETLGNKGSGGAWGYVPTSWLPGTYTVYACQAVGGFPIRSNSVTFTVISAEPPPPPEYIVGVGIYDEATGEYVKGTIIIDGVSYPDESSVTSRLEEGNHTFNVTPPTGYEFVRWDVYEYKTGGALIKTSTTRPFTINVTEPIWIWAVLQLSAAPTEAVTSLTISAPSTVEVDEPFTISGKLTRVDTGAGIAGVYVYLSYNGVGPAGALTGADGSYHGDATIRAPGIYTLKAEFAGTPAYGEAVGSLAINVGEVAPLAVDLPTIAGAALVIADVALVAAYLITQPMKVR
ncbi:hypothetical protein ES703_80274 [subsurface metagenome]